MMNEEKGIAIVMALILLLTMSVMGLTVSFLSNIDFKLVSNYKSGQESLIAAESCVIEGRRRIEKIGAEKLFFELQNSASSSSIPSDFLFIMSLKKESSTDPKDWLGPMCRSGPKMANGPLRFINDISQAKSYARAPKNTSLVSGGASSGALFPMSYVITGKSSVDRDKGDSDNKINTGTEIVVGFEVYLPTGGTNTY